MTNYNKQQRNGAKRQADNVSTNEFNRQSGAERQKAGESVIMPSKAQLLSTLKQTLPRFSGNQIILPDGEELTPTANQRTMIRNIETKPVNLVEGPSGTGKTMWACYMGLLGLVEKKFNNISLNAPAVEAGEKLGSLPGNADEKMLPHVNQILEAFDDFIGEDLRRKLCDAGIIKIVPHAYMRGRNLKKTFLILDECQNATGPNLQTALGRLGSGSVFVFMGDRMQNDRTIFDAAYSAVIKTYTHEAYSEFTAYSLLEAEDVRRHPFVKLMVERGDNKPLQGYENHRATGKHRHQPSVPPLVNS